MDFFHVCGHVPKVLLSRFSLTLGTITANEGQLRIYYAHPKRGNVSRLLGLAK